MKRNTAKFNLNDLSTWQLPVSLIIGALIIFGLVFILKSFVIDSITHSIKKKNSEVIKIESEYTTNKRILAILPQIKKEVQRLQNIRNDAINFLPTDVSMPSLIDSVYSSARKNNIVFDTFTPQPDIDTPYYTIKPISLSANVGYLSMAAFIADITTLKRIMNVHSVSFSATNKKSHNNGNAPLKMTAQLRTYIFKE